MNIQALRFLLHGSSEHYDSTETLFVTSESNSVWSKVASYIFEPWRIIPQELAEKILKDEREKLGIRSTSPKELIPSLDPSVLNGQDFTREERREILKQVSVDGSEDLWKKLPLHTADDGAIVSVTPNTYKGNPDFEIPLRLGSLVSIISETSRPEWISLWTPRAAITLILSQAQPEQYCDLLLKLIPQVNDLKLDGELSSHLKETPWLQLKTGQPIAPKNVILLSSGLANLTSALEQVFQSEQNCSYANFSMLTEKLQNPSALELVCQTWYDNDVLEFLLKNTQYPSTHVCLILKILKSLEQRKQTLRKNIIEPLQITKWLVDQIGQSRSPSQIIYLPEASEIVTELLSGSNPRNYVSPEMLREDIDILSSKYIPEWLRSGKSAFEILGEVVENQSWHHLGDLPKSQDLLENIVSVLASCPEAPVLALAQDINIDTFDVYIFPKLLKEVRGIEGSTKIRNILNWITTHHSNPKKEAIQVFNNFLSIACNLPDFCSAILPEIQLLNQSRRPEWCPTRSLCDGIDNHSIDPNYLLNEAQRTILSRYFDSRYFDDLVSTYTAPQNAGQVSQSQSEGNIEVDDLGNNAQTLEKYFTPWLNYVPSQVIGGVVTLLAGSDEDVQKLAKIFLKRWSFENIRDPLIWEQARTKTLTIEINQEESQKVRSLAGTTFDAPISNSHQPKTIFVGSLKSNISLRKLDLQMLDRSGNILVDLLFQSFKQLIQFLDESGYTAKQSLIEDIWKGLNDSQQIEVEVAKDFILKNSQHLLRSLGVQNHQIREQLRLWDDKEFALSIWHRRSHKNQKEFENLLKNIREISASIESLVKSEETQPEILKSVRKKIGEGQYGYHLSNIPFEIFQNADDAVKEIKYLSGNNNSDREYFVLKREAKRLVFMHWGRAINDFSYPNYRDQNLRDRGFDQDLVKMLSFNISDKPEDETGKFGLGFKTVHLVTENPAIISGDLSFRICGGILPLPINDSKILDGLREELVNEQLDPELTDGTLISLPIGEDCKDGSITLEFERQANLLLIFAKAIRKCKLITVHDSRDLSWSPISVFNIPEIEVGDVHLINSSRQWEHHKILCFRLSAGIIAITLPKNLDSSDSPLQDISPFWVTTPTKEDSGLRFIVNGDFDVTTGRTRLDPNSSHNRVLIEEIGCQFGEKLCQLFQVSVGDNWSSLKHILGFEGATLIQISPHILQSMSFELREKVDKLLAMANQFVSPHEAKISQSKLVKLLAAHGVGVEHESDRYKFWKFLWDVFATDWLNKSSESISTSLIIHGFSGISQGIGRLISICKTLPNGLSGQLVNLQNVKYQVAGLLAESSLFACISSWKIFQDCYSEELLISHKIWRDVKRLLSTDEIPEVENLDLADCLREELGDRNIKTVVASRIGHIINSDNLRAWESSNRLDHKRILEVLKSSSISFMNQSGGYLAASFLLLYQPDDPEEKRLVDPEEKRLVAFAPPNRILHPDYTDTALQFFRVCRLRRETIEIDELVQWARAANTESQQQGVLEYLSSGDRNLDFSRLLTDSISGCWMANDPRVQSLLKTKERQSLEDKALRGEITWDQISPIDDPPFTATTSPPPHLAEPNQLEDIYAWWEKNHLTELESYNKRLYPIDITELQCGLIDDDRSAWLMLLFIGATHTMGRTTHEQHRDFIRFCVEKGWWDIFSSPEPQDEPEQWIEVLNSYIDSLSNDTTWYSWMEKYPNIYQLSKYLDEYRESFCSADRIHNAFNLRALTNPRIASHLSRGG